MQGTSITPATRAPTQIANRHIYHLFSRTSNSAGTPSIDVALTSYDGNDDLEDTLPRRAYSKSPLLFTMLGRRELPPCAYTTACKIRTMSNYQVCQKMIFCRGKNQNRIQ